MGEAAAVDNSGGEAAAAASVEEGAAAEATVLEGGEAAASGGDTVLESGASAGEAAAPEVPEKFRKEDGSLDTEKLQNSYNELSDKLHAGGAPPKDVDGYKLNTEMPDGVELDKDGHAKFLELCLEKGMNNDQVQFVMDQASEIVSAGVDYQKVTVADVSDGLKKEWGNDYDKNLNQAFNAFNALASDIEGASMKEVGNNALMIRLLSVAGASLSEDQLPQGMPAPGSIMTEADLSAVMRSEAYLTAEHPEHAQAMEKVTRHHKAAAARKKK